MEERVEHSSFSSSSSSIIRLLSSTPNKLQYPADLTSPKRKHALLRKSPVPQIPESEEYNVHFADLIQEKKKINEENILHDFLNNLKRIVQDKDIQVEFAERGNFDS